MNNITEPRIEQSTLLVPCDPKALIDCAGIIFGIIHYEHIFQRLPETVTYCYSTNLVWHKISVTTNCFIRTCADYALVKCLIEKIVNVRICHDMYLFVSYFLLPKLVLKLKAYFLRF